MKSGLLGGLAATTLVAMGGVASADAVYTGTGGSDCPGCTVTVILSGTPGSPIAYTPPTSYSFTPLDLGTGSPDGLQSSATLNSPGGEISSISFAGGTPNASGVYAGNSTGVALSPFGGDGSGSPDPPNKYLVAEGGGGTVTINYFSTQTSLDLLWGTVDTTPADYNELSFSTGSQTITGADIAAIVGSPPFSDSDLDVAVEITGLSAFTTLTASDNSSNAFEFDVAAPAPPIGRGLPVVLAVGGMLFGIRLWGRGKKRFSFGAGAPHAAA